MQGDYTQKSESYRDAQPRMSVRAHLELLTESSASQTILIEWLFQLKQVHSEKKETGKPKIKINIYWP